MATDSSEPASGNGDRIEPLPEDDSPPPPRAFGRHSNRRVRTTGSLQTCRMCWKPITIEARFIEAEPPRLFFRCPHCTHSFPIRHSDVPAEYWAPAVSDVVPVVAADPHTREIWAMLGDNVIEQLDFGTVRALLERLNAVHQRHGSTTESRALQGALHAREQILIALEDLAEVLRTIEADTSSTR